jgi:hypothetical protein
MTAFFSSKFYPFYIICYIGVDDFALQLKDINDKVATHFLLDFF